MLSVSRNINHESFEATAGIMTAGATWAVCGCTMMLVGLFVLVASKCLGASPLLMAAGSLLTIFSVISSFFNTLGWVSYGICVSLRGAIIVGIGVIFSALYIKFREMAK
ncbi:MAG: hypothetical protein JSV85_04750 [Candidatus Bathyarchaeota archaeon]|nr:MAG: hypothetical protein JSV85_04750 [Candidatus Bathyarchaeota archaeon]